MKKIFVITISLLFFGVAFSQPIDTARFKLDFTPRLQNFQKITQPAVIPDEPQEAVDFEYEITPQSIDLTFSPTPLKPIKLPGEVMKKLYRNFLKIGFGFPATPFGELCIHNFDNTKFSYGLNVNHISGWAQSISKTMKNYAYAPFSDTRILLFFNTFFKNQTLYSSVGYNHEVAHLYGFNRYNTPDSLHYFYEKIHRDSLKNNFHHLRAEIGLRSNFLQADDHLKQDVRLNYDFLTTYKKDMENHIGLTSFFLYDFNLSKLNGFIRPQVDFNVDYFMNHWYNAEQIANTITYSSYKLEFIPTVKFAVREYHIRLGLGLPVINSLDAVMHGEAKCPIYPVAEVQLGVVPGILSIYAGIDGNVKYNSLKDLLYENPFVKPGLDSLQFTKTRFSIYGGVKGNLVKKLNYHISARYSHTNDMAFFFLDTLSLLKNQFDVVYSDVDLLNVCANINWQVVDRLYLNLEANYWGYFNLKSIEKPWYKPAWEVAFSGKYYLKEKFIFDLNMKLGFDAYRPVTAEERARMDTPLNGTIYAATMKPILNFGAGFEYLVTKRFSCFAMLNNIGFQYFSKYYDFNNLGFNAIVGVTYSFGDESLKRGKR
ncbi:MAG: hypothetical protein FWF70_05715 [Bacteroidetes bacterium]|nr:hypothetical protein [Bacteroidota bacterium]MCL1968360.1 hypothetical protein [Bacteroidota bacterium]